MTLESSVRGAPPPGGNGSPSAAGDLADHLLGKEAHRLHFVDRRNIRDALAVAIGHALQVQFAGLNQPVVDAVTRSATDSFFRVLRYRSREARSFSRAEFAEAMARIREALVQEREQARHQLHRLERELDEHRAALAEEERALLEGETAEGADRDRELEERLRALFAEHSGDPVRLEQEVVETALAALREERQKVLALRLAEHNRHVERLERRIQKLVRNLEITEEQLRRLARMKDVDPGLASIFRTVQGLSPEDVNYETKQALMTAIFKANLELRRKMASGG